MGKSDFLGDKSRVSGLGPPPATKVKAKKKSRSKKAAPKPNWVPILRVVGYDFDEDGVFLDSSQTVELQQDTASKKIRAIVVPD